MSFTCNFFLALLPGDSGFTRTSGGHIRLLFVPGISKDLDYLP